jgi:hypothetical protein
MSEINRKPPYGNTNVPYERTKGEIEKLLKSYGVKGIRWTMMEGLDDQLEFIIEADVRGIKRQIGIMINPPHIFIKKRKGYGSTVHTENINQEYRLLYHWIKSKIEAVVWGLSLIEKEFLSEIMLSLPDGRHEKVGEIVLNLVGENRLESLPFLGENEQKKRIEQKPIIDI